jgi:hypothetical protein
MSELQLNSFRSMTGWDRRLDVELLNGAVCCTFKKVTFGINLGLGLKIWVTARFAGFPHRRFDAVLMPFRAYIALFVYLEAF